MKCKLVMMLLITVAASAQKNKSYQLSSPDGNIVIKIEAGNKWAARINTVK